jgi:hypothetical protein
MNMALRVCLFAGLLVASPLFFPVTIAANVGVAPSSLRFGSVPVNAVSSAATITVTNSSNQGITVSSVTSSLPEFVVDGISAPIFLAARSSTTVAVYFKPDAAGTFNGTIVVHGAKRGGGSASVAVSGVGISDVPPATSSLLSMSTASLAFGSVQVGTSVVLPFTITNPGTTTVSVSRVTASGKGFSVSGFSGSTNLSAGQSLSLAATFSPNTSVSVTGAISVTSNASNSPSSMVLTGAGVQPAISVNRSSLSFGSVLVGQSQSQTVTVQNSGSADLTITQATLSGTSFSLSAASLPLTIAAGGTASFSVGFAPASAGNFTASLSFMSNATTAPVVVALGGTGSSQTFLLASSRVSLGFGNQLVGAAATQTATISNTGNSSVTISSITETGAGFTLAPPALPVTLLPGQAMSFSVTFAPAIVGNLSGSVSVSSNSTNSPLTIPLSGTGVQPQITVVPASASFGNLTVGSTNSQTITMQNPGTSTLSLSQATVSGNGFSISGLTLPLSLPPGNSATFNLSFAPASAVSYSGTLTLASNASTSPTNIALSGTGVSPLLQLSASPTALGFGSLNIGTSSMQTLTVTNTGNSTVSISQATASGTSFTAAAMSLPITLAAGQSTSVTVNFAPTTAGPVSGTLTVVSNATNSPLLVALSGSGSSAMHSVNLSWTPGSTTYAGFNVYRGTTSGGPYSRISSSLILAPSFTDIGVDAGQSYYYVATEVDPAGTESAYSAEVSAVIP